MDIPKCESLSTAHARCSFVYGQKNSRASSFLASVRRMCFAHLNDY